MINGNFIWYQTAGRKNYTTVCRYDIAVTKEYTDKVLSFTVDYNNQSESMAIIGLYTVDDNGKYSENIKRPTTLVGLCYV